MSLLQPMLGDASRSRRPPIAKHLLRRFKDELSLVQRVIRFLLFQDVLMSSVVKRGAANAAKVIDIGEHLIVAAQSTDFDDVVFLQFDLSLVAQHKLQLGDHLLTCSNFTSREDLRDLAADLIDGSGSTRNFKNFHPIILQFVSDDKSAIRKAMDTLPHWEWGRLDELADEMAPFRMRYPRKGNPYLSGNANPMAADGIRRLRAERLNSAKLNDPMPSSNPDSDGSMRLARRRRR